MLRHNHSERPLAIGTLFSPFTRERSNTTTTNPGTSMVQLPQRTLRAVIEHSTHVYAERPALSMIGGASITYAQLLHRVQSLAVLLRDKGIVSGDRVSILSESQPNWGVAYFAVTYMGAVVVPILPDFHQNEIRHILRHSESKAIFVSKKNLQRIEGEELPHLSTIIVIDDFSEYAPKNSSFSLAHVKEQGERSFALLKEAALKFVGKIPDEVTPDDLAAIVYTSGTTGHSKGVMLTHKNIVSDAIGTTGIVDVSCDDRFLSILPLAHTYECTLGLVTAMLVGASVHYLDKLPTASVLLPAMKEVKPTVMLSVPLVIEKIYKTRIYPQLTGSMVKRGIRKIPFLRKRIHSIAGKKLLHTFGGKLQLFAIGGAPLAHDVELFLREAHFPYAMGYGLTETSPLIAGSNPQKTKYRATGTALPETSLRIDHPDPATGEGEIIVKGSTVMKGYYKDPERTKEAFTDDGWFRTGDLGVIDNDGRVSIKGRLKNMILGPSGKNIYPEEIESIINEHELILESIVYQQEHKLVARVFLDYDKIDAMYGTATETEAKAEKTISKIIEELKNEINEKLSSFSRIAQMIEQTEPFEKTPTQKIKRHLYI